MSIWPSSRKQLLIPLTVCVHLLGHQLLKTFNVGCISQLGLEGINKVLGIADKIYITLVLKRTKAL